MEKSKTSLNHKATPQWGVEVTPCGDHVVVKCVKGFTVLTNWDYVSKPNLIERLLGISFLDKVNVAVRRKESECQALNRDEGLALQVVEQYYTGE